MNARRLARAVAGLLAVALLAGCASIPLTGPVQEGNPVDRSDDLGFDFRPQGPENGDTPAEILSGFVAAGAGPQDNYSIAREFLTRDFAAKWNPSAGALIHEGTTSAVPDTETRLRLVVPATAGVDASGAYSEYSEPMTVELSFRFAKENGEWRISQAPDGTVLAAPIFDRLFAPRTLYFYDPTFTYLVPDVRWFPSTADAPTRVVEALLAGPSAPLAPPVLATAFPEGTKLERQSVTPTGGQALVELGDEVVQTDALTRQRMQYQLARSLVGGSILSVRISVDGSPLEIPEPGSGTAPIVQPLVDPSPLVLRSGVFGRASGQTVEPLAGLSDTVAGLDPSAAVASADHRLVALLAADGSVYSVPAGSDPIKLDSRPDLIAPALDGQGWTWTVPAGDPAGLTARKAGKDPVSVAVNWGDASRVVSIAVSRDSTRLLALVVTPEGPRLRVYGIARDGGQPALLSATWFDLVPPEGTPVAATWVSDTLVASLGRSEEGSGTVTTQEIGGQVVDDVGSVPDAVQLVGGNGLSGLRILTSDGAVRVLRGTAWQTTVRDVQLIATQR